MVSPESIKLTVLGKCGKEDAVATCRGASSRVKNYAVVYENQGGKQVAQYAPNLKKDDVITTQIQWLLDTMQ